MKKSTLIELFVSHMHPVNPYIDNRAVNNALEYLNKQGEDIPHAKLKSALEYLKDAHLRCALEDAELRCAFDDDHLIDNMQQ